MPGSAFNSGSYFPPSSSGDAPHEPVPGSDADRDDPVRNDAVEEDGPPAFGALDIVEAFTAMRHEWRGQTKESRAVAEQIEQAVAGIQSLEAKLLARVAEHLPDDGSETERLAGALADIEHHLARAITAAAQWEATRHSHESAELKAIQRYFEGMGRLARWFARPLLAFVLEQRTADAAVAEESANTSPAIEGLNLVLARLRRTMKEQQLERLDTVGQAFDANMMNAIGTVASEAISSGHVAEQLTPAYLWQGRILRFAEVRVAE